MASSAFDNLARQLGGSLNLEALAKLAPQIEARPEDFDPLVVGEFHQFMSMGRRMFAPLTTEESDELYEGRDR